MSEDKKRELEQNGAFHFVKKACEASGREYNEYFIYLLASYVDSLTKLSLAFPVDINYAMISFIHNVKEINLVNPYLDKSGLVGTNLKIASSENIENINVDFFSECTNILAKKSVFKNKAQGEKSLLQNANNEYITQIVYGVSKNSDIANQINADHDNENASSYSNFFSSNPVFANLINIVALSCGLSINYVLSLSMKENGEEMLKVDFDKIHGIGSFDKFIDQVNSIKIPEEKIDASKTASLTAADLLNSGQNVEVINSLSLENLEKLENIENNLVKNFLSKNTDDYIIEHYEELENAITSYKVREHFRSEFKQIRDKVQVRVLEKPNGFIGLKYILGTIIFILIVIFIAVTILK